MLVLTRKFREEIVIDLPDGKTITIAVVDIERGRVRLGIDAPRSLPIHRKEIRPLNKPDSK